LLVFSWGLFGCTLPAASDVERPSLVSLGGESLSALPLVPRLSLAGALPIDPEDVWLVRGTLSKKEQAQIVASAPGGDLEERRVPLAAWSSEGALTLAPLTVLESGQDYTLLALSLGELAELVTRPDPSPIWWQWSRGTASAGGWQIYCALPPPWQVETVLSPERVGEAPGALAQARLEPGGLEVEVLAGFADASDPLASGALDCVRFRVPEISGGFLPPHEVAGRFFEPSLLWAEQGLPAAEAEPPDLRLEGSAALLALPQGSAEVVLTPSMAGSMAPQRRRFLIQTPSPSTLCLGLLEPGDYVLSASLLDARGGLELHSLTFAVREERGRPVLSEVLSNPLGPEPESEWVELVNVGRAPLDLAGWVLEDADGGVTLPSVTLPPGGVGLVVRQDFVPASSGDVAPAADAVPIFVAELGDGGLSNSGEVLRLRAPTGELVSEVPAAKTAAGQSLARRDLLAPDWPSSFGPHASPGASPGSANVVSSGEGN